LLKPILDVIVETMPRDNLLSSACLELFDFIKQSGIKPLIRHLVENYREQMRSITYVDTFRTFVNRYDATQGFAPSAETSFLDTDEDTPRRPEAARGTRWQQTGVKDLDAHEEEYFNTSDEDEAQEHTPTRSTPSRTSVNGASPSSKPLVDYGSDEENENADAEATLTTSPSKGNEPESPASKSSEDEKVLTPTSSTAPSPPERVSEKRRREEDEEDELGKLSQSKRRSSSTNSTGSGAGNVLRRKKSFTNSGANNNSKTGKIAISLSPAIRTGGENRGENTE
jgi:protein phosphatase-4 regulatory subunit 3